MRRIPGAGLRARLGGLGALLALALATPGPGARAQNPTVPAPQGSRLDFQDARLSDVIRALAALIGVNAVLADIPEQRITLTTAGLVAPAALPQVLESLPEAHGLVLVLHGSVAQVGAASSAPATGQLLTRTAFPCPPP